MGFKQSIEQSNNPFSQSFIVGAVFVKFYRSGWATETKPLLVTASTAVEHQQSSKPVLLSATSPRFRALFWNTLPSKQQLFQQVLLGTRRV